MPNIPYPDLDAIDDPEILGILERARRVGTPPPESQAIRAHVPAVVKSFSKAWQETFVDGVVNHALKELCREHPACGVHVDHRPRLGIERSRCRRHVHTGGGCNILERDHVRHVNPRRVLTRVGHLVICERL